MTGFESFDNDICKSSRSVGGELPEICGDCGKYRIAVIKF